MQLNFVFVATALLALASPAMSATLQWFSGADCTGSVIATSNGVSSESGLCIFLPNGGSAKSISYSGVPNDIEFFISGGAHGRCLNGSNLTRSGSGCATAPAGLYVRDNYRQLYEYLCARHAKEAKGVVVTGSPGVGKSFFNLYALARRLAEQLQKTTIFRTGTGNCFIFDTEGVSVLSLDNLDAYQLTLGVERSKNFVWCLFDNPDKAPVKESKTGSCWYMDVWGLKELREGLSLHGSTLDDKNYTYFYGPCIRDHCTEPAVFKAKIDEAFAQIQDFNGLADAFRAVQNCDKTLNMLTLRIFIVRCRDGVGPAMDFKSEMVLELFKAKWSATVSGERKRLLSICTGVPQTGILRSWVFEELAIQVISGIAPNYLLKVGNFYDTVLKEKTNRAKETKKDTVPQAQMEEEEEEEEEGSRVFVKLRYDKLPCQERKICIYKQIDEVSISDDYFCAPENKSNSLFDAFFFEVLINSRVIVWVLQFTTSTTTKQKGSHEGYAILEQIRTKGLAKFGHRGRVDFNFYVLGVPRERENSGRVTYKLPPDYIPATGSPSKWIPGHLYVQFLDV
ncbi:hypothetical protein K435DRAFT_971799 [Dendrothele bispora CBS 962.96]|uniref:Crinkler (CRN) family protein n=1 Tax=Dendrothele bispora (strain CBS 962.96) TaxID=1314807 RepID=A0A4S8L331_DENBC|nr:hypothetical protein K435DRAFT_971799 [Dendrothele bispora CBS 962.96]